VTPEELDAIKARVNAATPGPWERGDVYGTAGVGFGHQPGKCALCHHGEPVWVGEANINGRTMQAHRHRDPEPYEPDHRITGPDGQCIAGNYDYEAGGILEPADTEFITHARTDVPALLAELDLAKAVMSRALGEVEHENAVYLLHRYLTGRTASGSGS
jgi:hypothetical protein